MKQFFTICFLFILQTFYAQTLQDSLIAHYKLDGNAQDATVNGNDGIIYGNPTSTADRFGNPNSAYKMDGIDDIIRISNFNDGVMPTADEFTSSIWIKPIGKKTSHIFSQGTGCIATSKEYLTMGLTYNSGYSDFYASLYYTNPWAIFDDVYVFDGDWHHVVYTYDKGSSKLYVDGNLISTQTVTHPPNNNFFYTSSTDWTIGGIHSNNCGYNAHYDGYIDDVRVYTRALNSAEIVALGATTSNKEEFNEANFKIMPVPANQHLNLNFEFEGNKDLTIEIINILGQVVAKEVFSKIENQLNIQFDVSQLPVGNYIIQLSEQDHNAIIDQISKRFIIQR